MLSPVGQACVAFEKHCFLGRDGRWCREGTDQANFGSNSILASSFIRFHPPRAKPSDVEKTARPTQDEPFVIPSSET